MTDGLFDEPVPIDVDAIDWLLAQEDPAAAIRAVLNDKSKMQGLALAERYAVELLYLTLRDRGAKAKDVEALQRAVTQQRRQVDRDLRTRFAEPETPPTAEEIIAKLASEVDDATAGVLNLATLLDDIVGFTRRFVWFILTEQAHAIALWIMHTYVIPGLDTSPRLSVRAPTKACGKTRLLEVLEQIVFQGHLWVSPTSAVVFRTLGTGPATLLLDEIDTIYGPRAKGDEDLRSIIDAGQRRGATVPRCVGDENKVVPFPCFGPIALGGIGHLPGTIEDRSIIISLAKKRRSEKVERFRSTKDAVKAPAADIRARAVRWADEHLIDIATAVPDLPDELTDRQQDGWEPLLAVAEAAGGEWPTRARTAALALSAAEETDDSKPTLLLSAVRSVFQRRGFPDMLSCTEIVSYLNELEDEEWATWNRGAGIRPYNVGRILKEFGVSARQSRKDSKYRRCFFLKDLTSAWEQYLRTVDITDSEEDPPEKVAGDPDVTRVTRDAEVLENFPGDISLFDLTEGEEEE